VKKFGFIAILTVAIVLGSLLSVPSCVEAQESELTDEESIFFYEIPSIYTASKHEQKVTEAPSSVSIITADEIQMYGYRTLAEILESVRGMFITNDRNYSYLGVRGFARPGDYNTRVLILVDGVRLNDAIYDTGAIGTEMILDVDIIERVEIVRGPSSSLYGTNAFFGVVNIITKRGRDLQGPEFSGSAGSLETYKGRLSYGDKLANGVEIFLSGTYYESEGNKELHYEEFDDPGTNNGVAEACDSGEFLSFFGKIAYKDFTLEGAHNDRDKRIPTGAYGTVFNNPGTYTTDEQGVLSLKYHHTFENQQNVLAMVSYNHYYYYGAYVYDYGELEPDIVTNEDYAKGDWITGEVQYSIPMYDKHHVVMGAEYRDNVRQNQENFDIFETYLADERDSYYLGFFVNDEANLAEEFTLNIGARYDYFETFGGTVNPRVAAVYDPLERTTLKALYGRAFRAPNAYELYYHDAWYSQKPGGDLEPETINTYELIVEQYITDQIFGTVNGFFYQINDLITLVTDPEDDLLIFRNAEEIEAMGVELGIEGRLDLGIRGRISYSYVETEDKEAGEVLTNSPRHLAKLNLIAPLMNERLFAAAEVRYTDKRRTLAGEYTDAFVAMNVNISAQLFENRVNASFGIYNLLDQEYFDPASEEHIQDAIMQDGRTFRASLILSY
jgi:outer membrane receptor for ferrienterochelin and colicins